MGGSQGGSQGGAGKVSISNFDVEGSKTYWRLQGTYGKDTLRPVTIKQILDAQQPHPDAEFKIDDVEITQVCTSSLPPFQLYLLIHPWTDHFRRPNSQHLHSDHKHNLQAR